MPTAAETRSQVQSLLGVTPDKVFGPRTRDAYDRLAVMPADGYWPEAAPLQARQINDAGLTLVKHFEGFYGDAYRDEVGVWTIGYGHTGLQHKDGTVFRGRTVTRAEADQLLQYDMHQFEARVSALVSVPLNDNEFSALVSFDFNTGGLSNSTLRALLNRDDREAAADQFLRWNRAGGRVLAGLTRRRQSERNLFLSILPAIVPT
jgi:lysozyme